MKVFNIKRIVLLSVYPEISFRCLTFWAAGILAGIIVNGGIATYITTVTMKTVLFGSAYKNILKDFGSLFIVTGFFYISFTIFINHMGKDALYAGFHD